MRALRWLYSVRGKPIPYYANYSIWLVLWKPVRKFLNVVIVPNIPFNMVRVILYRLLRYQIGKGVFIGMKCYLDDVDPRMTVIEDRVTISYGCYFACHGKGQGHNTIRIRQGAYIGMRASIISGRQGVEIGSNAIVGACALVTKSIPPNATAVGIPAKVVGYKASAYHNHPVISPTTATG